MVRKCHFIVFMLIFSTVSSNLYAQTQTINLGNLNLSNLFQKKDKNKKEVKEKDNKKKGKKTKEEETGTNNNTPLTAGENEVLLVVTGDGATKDIATTIALRSAIEQTFGVFVSSHTEILNDNLVKDEIATISSGNIRDFKYISERESDGIYHVTLQAIVSIGKLISYTKAKGGETELAGATFAANIRLNRLIASNTAKALTNLFLQINEMLPYAYDFGINVSDPFRITNSKMYSVHISVDIKATKTAGEIYDYFHRTLKAISTQTSNYDSQYFEIIGQYGNYSNKWTYRFQDDDVIIRSSKDLMTAINDLTHFNVILNWGFIISDGVFHELNYDEYTKNVRMKLGFSPSSALHWYFSHENDKYVDKLMGKVTHDDISGTISFGGAYFFKDGGNFYYIPILVKRFEAGNTIYTMKYLEKQYDGKEYNYIFKYTLDEISKVSKFTVTPKRYKYR